MKTGPKLNLIKKCGESGGGWGTVILQKKFWGRGGGGGGGVAGTETKTTDCVK